MRMVFPPIGASPLTNFLPPTKKLCLVDAHGYLHRAFHALPPLTNPQGEPVGALFGFAKMLFKILRQETPDALVVCYDTSAPTFRHKVYPLYKAHRPETDQDLKSQLPRAREMTEAWGLFTLGLEGYEADDLIGTLASRGAQDGYEVVVVSGDKDALQLVGGSVVVLNEQRGVRYDAGAVGKKYGLRPDQLVDFFALTGDASDNIPGVAGVGEKTATTLLQRFDSLDGIYARLDEVTGAVQKKLREGESDARLSRTLVVLDRNVPLLVPWADCRPPRELSSTFEAYLRGMGFFSLLGEGQALSQFLRNPQQIPPIPPFSKGGTRLGDRSFSPFEKGGQGGFVFEAIAKDHVSSLSPLASVSVPGALRQASQEERGNLFEGLKRLSPITDRTVHTVLTQDDLTALAQELRTCSEFSVDVETTGLDSFSCRLVGISLATKPGEAWYVPVGHSYLGTPPQLDFALVRTLLAPIFCDPKIPKIGHHLKFDSQVLARAGLPVFPLSFDTLVASYCLNPSRLSHGLKSLALDFLGIEMTPLRALIGSGVKEITMDEVKIEDAAPYAGADAEVTLRLKQLMEPLLEEKSLTSLFRQVEMPLVSLLSGMEEVGVRLDVLWLDGLAKSFDREKMVLEKEIQSLAGEPVNVQSPKQLAVILFEKLNLPVIRRTKTGPSTDEEVLLKLSAQHPLPEKILVHRELAKLKSTYIDGLLVRVKESGRVHTQFNQTVTATGRLSSSDPNVQNIPIRTEHGRQIRRSFIPAEGCVFLSGDYSQIDLRVLAHISGDPALGAAFRSGQDIHSATARDIFCLSPEAPVTDDQRRTAKSVNFGIVYGQTGYGLSQQLGIPLKEAQTYINAYLEKYAGVKVWMDRVISDAKRDGYVTTLLNRRRYLPDILASNGALRGFAERTAMNTPIQGTSADIIKVAMLNLAKRFQEEGWKTRILLQVHDDWLFEVPREEFPLVVDPIRVLMETALPLAVPVVVDLKVGDCWADMKKI